MDKKKSFGESPEDQARLESMGTNRVLKDLAKKYKPANPTEVEPSSDLSPEDQARFEAIGGSAVLEHLKQRRNKFLKELEQLPKQRETYKKQELEAIFEVEKRLQVFIKEFDQAAAIFSKGSPEYKALCEKYIEQVMQILDQGDFWAYKFTTEDSGGAASDQPFEFTDQDSVYYMTQSGISLRLKRSVSELGLGVVIQPFYEKIVFGQSDSDVKDTEPQIGGRVTEFRSAEFCDLLNGDEVSGDLESTNEIYLKDGKIFFVNSNDPKPHEGDRVNRILEVR
ncbi:MAG: hypothetical protein ABII13_02160 [Patescibacteria group bacterium]|nr:hypothetical protein [Patescibacteria group bacterium]MBU2508992.1 hypothetical protein [Patescibacteria group bacterium]